MNINKHRSELMTKLTEAGIRPSVQRIAILEYISECRSHPTADEIYSVLVKDNPMLSRTTVFSCLKLLAEKGIINNIDISPDSTRYDSAVKAPHAHFMCRRCKRIIDIPFDMQAMHAPAEYDCDSVNIYFKGLCPECSKNNN